LLKQKKAYRRGYPVAMLVGLEDDRAVSWKVFSNVVKPEKTIWLDGSWNDPEAIYNFCESIVNSLRPAVKEGVASVILASPARTDYVEKFIDHVHGHHVWLVQGPNKATFSEANGHASTLSEVTAMTRTQAFRRLVSETTSEEAESLIDILGKRLNTANQDTVIAYSLKETEDLILGDQRTSRPEPEYLILTNRYLSNSKEKNRIHRLLQVATNRNVKTRIVDAESPAGLRLTQLGGMVCIAKLE
jgi:stalled ribosome rescue protein Dom34